MIKTEILPAEEPESIATAVQILRNGGLVAFPTDTVYGVGAMVSDPTAIQRLYQVKERSHDKAIPVLIADLKDMTKISQELPAAVGTLAERFWPGPLTLVVKRRWDLPQELGEEATVGVRIPDQPAALQLLDATGPLAVTSANISGQPNSCTPAEVLAGLDGRIELLLDGGDTPGGVPSTVVDCTTSPYLILRKGPINEEEIEALLP